MQTTYASRIRIVVVVNLVFAAACGAATSNDAEGRLAQLLKQYQLPRTLHCKVNSTTEYKIIPPGIFRVDGTQEFWVDGPKYRIAQVMNSSLLAGMSHDVRWDGEQYQWFNLADATLIISKKPKQKMPYIGEPIPLLPLGFLNPGGDDLGVRLSLDELRGDEIRGRLADTHFVGPDDRVAEFPGGTIEDTKTTYQIEFGASPNYLPTTIRRLSPDGVAIDTDEIEYQPTECTNGVIYLPSWARITNRTTDNRIYMVATFKVTMIEADIDIPPETFTIDFQTAKNVINTDRFSHRVLSGQPKAAAPSDTATKLAGTDASHSASSEPAQAVSPMNSTINTDTQWPPATIGLLAGSLLALVAGSVMVFRTKPATGAQE